jgi:hypothetical protein
MVDRVTGQRDSGALVRKDFRSNGRADDGSGATSRRAPIRRWSREPFAATTVASAGSRAARSRREGTPMVVTSARVGVGRERTSKPPEHRLPLCARPTARDRASSAVMRSRLMAGVAVAVLSLLASCSSASSLPDRSALPSCGESHFNESPTHDKEVLECFNRAAKAGKPAEVVLTRSTVEGKRYQAIDRVLGPHSFESFTREGSASWNHQRCSVLGSEQGDPLFADCKAV